MVEDLFGLVFLCGNLNVRIFRWLRKYGKVCSDHRKDILRQMGAGVFV